MNKAGPDFGWEDIKAPATQTKVGSNLKPDFDFTNLGLLFPQDDATEIAYVILQFPHNRRDNSPIHPHIHYLQTSSASPTFKIDYRWYENNATPGAFTTIAQVGNAFPYSSGSIIQIATFPEIDGTAIQSVSSIFEAKIYRDDDAVTGDVLYKEFDLHYQIDQPLGSRNEFIK